MNACEAANRLYVPGMPNPGKVNRYYVLSEMLRDRGWSGVGDYWWESGHESPVSFKWALNVSGLGLWYDWAVTKEIMECDLSKVGERLSEARVAVTRAMREFGKAYQRRLIEAGEGGE